MSIRWPDLELLRSGQLIALSPLSRPRSQDAMSRALRRLAPGFGDVDGRGPDAAIVEALAACVEVMGFYHDRFLTESKLGAAQLLDDLARVVALVGYRPRPAIAATAYQWFEALTAGIVPAGTRVSGAVASPPAVITYETSATIELAPELNRMALSPLLTRSPGAVRAILAPQRTGRTLPTDDFRPRTTAQIVDAHGIELAPIGDSRSRGVAFDRGLSRSFEPTAQVARATVIRRLRNPCDLADDLVALEVSTTPILHLPSVAAPELLSSTLEIFVLRPGDDALDPSEWPAALRYTEVVDFSASEAADLHYRTFVDDQLHTWIILRTQLGARVLPVADALDRIYARFVPAIGRVVAPDATAGGPSVIPSLTGVTLGLDLAYFASSVVVPPLPGLAAHATWVMVDRELGLDGDASILIEDGSGQRWVRTLSGKAWSPRLLSWEAPQPPGVQPLPEAHDPVPGALDPATAKIGSLTDAAGGDAFATWSELYAQLRPNAAFDVPELPIVSSRGGAIESQCIVPAGTTYLVLADASHISVGDFIVIGRRLTAAVRSPQALGDWRWKPGESFDPHTPWLDAEVVQAVELRGNVVRLATPVSQSYVAQRARSGPPLAEIVALPGVVSVASGDQLRQVMTLSTGLTFKGDDEQIYDAGYLSAALDRGYPAGDLRRVLRGETTSARWSSLFLAVAGAGEAQTDLDWTQFDIVVRAQHLRVPSDQIARLENDAGVVITSDPVASQPSESPLVLVDAAAARSLAETDDSAVIAVLDPAPRWQRTDGAPAAHQFRIRELVSFDLVPTPLDIASAHLFADDTSEDRPATLILVPGAGADPGAAFEARFFAFHWDAAASAPHVQDHAPELAEPFEAILVSRREVARLDAAIAVVDWFVPGARFVDAGFAQVAAGALIGSKDQRRVIACPFVPADPELPGLTLRAQPRTGASIHDPLDGCAEVWAVQPDTVEVLAAQARWVYALADDDRDALPAATALRLAMAGGVPQIVAATSGEDGRSATIDPEVSARSGDLGVARTAIYGLEAAGVTGALISASEIWAWQDVSPPIADLPEPAASRFVAVVPTRDGKGLRTIEWPREAVWWDAARRTLRLPIEELAERPELRPADLVRLLQVLTPAVERRELEIAYDAAADRSLVTLAVPPGWPSPELAPAPVVIAALVPGARRAQGHAAGHELEVRDALAAERFTTARGHVRWTLHFAGDVRRRWANITIALRDWSAPGERGLAVAPLWCVTGSPAWHARAAAGPVTLIVTTRDQRDFLALPAMPRIVGDRIELAPLGADSVFPGVAAVVELDVAIYERSAPPALTGTTLLDVAPGPDAQITHVVFESADAWQPIPVRSITLEPDRRRYELAVAYLSLFPDGIATSQRVWLGYATSALAPATATALALRFQLAGLGVAPAHGVGANAVVFHTPVTDDDGNDIDTPDDFVDYILLDTAAPPQIVGDDLIVELALDHLGLGNVFDDQGTPYRTSLCLAQHWPLAMTKALEPQPLRVELGGDLPAALAPGDVFQLGFSGGRSVASTALSYGDGVLALAPTVVQAPDTLTLYGLRTHVDPIDYGATLSLAPSAPEPPWLLSFDNDPSPSSLVDTLLPYTLTEPAPTSGPAGRRHFRFAQDAAVADIFRRAGDPATTLYLFGNERGELRGELYTSADAHIAHDLGDAVHGNFLTAAATDVVDRLVLGSSAWAGQRLDQPRPIVLTAAGVERAPLAELRIVSAEPRRVATGRVVQSVRFNTGNFIPLASQRSNPATTVARALRVFAQPLDRDGARSGNPRSVQYTTLDALGALNAANPVALSELEQMTYRDAVLGGQLQAEPSYEYAASFSAAGVCTLHFAFVDDALIDTVEVRIETQYNVAPNRAGNGLTDPVYPLETAVVGFSPATQIALLAPGALKPGALVFVRRIATDTVPALQWARVTRVTGPIVDLDRALDYASDALEPIAVTGLGRLQNAARLDADYYAGVAKAKLVQDRAAPATWHMPVRDRLAIDVGGEPAAAALLRSLVPGDLVLVFDERRRHDWGVHRQGGTLDGHDSTTWPAWPDAQHQAVVKQVDAETGLLVLSAPLPDSFQLDWTLVGDHLTPSTADVQALRVLPHDRAPIHGPRTLEAIGTGDTTRRFARFLTSIEAGVGSAVIPLAADGVSIGNLEVLAFDPVKAAWSRWLRYDTLARAGKKDPAFTLGFRPTAASDRTAVSITFGDGVTGQLLPTGTDNVYLRTTQIAAPSNLEDPAVRIVRVDPIPNALLVRLETSAPIELIGSSELGAAQWQPALQITALRGDGSRVDFTEISATQAAGGAHGYVFADTAPPPGSVDVYLFAQPSVGLDAKISAVQLAGSRSWSVDAAFYSEAARRELTAAPGATSIQLRETAGLRAGSQIAVFLDDASPPDIARLAAIDPPTWSAVLETPLPRAYDLDRSFVRGNLAPITQGAVDDITLGSSDGVTPKLRLPLQNRAPLIYVERAGVAPAPDITVSVDGQDWTPVLDFTDRTASDRVWRLELDGDAAFVVFGDGQHGAIPPAGRDNITARVRTGKGAEGNLAAGAIAKLVSGNLAIKSTRNVTAAAGGSAGDTADQAREKAFAHELPSDRVVSAGDCVRAALNEGGVIAAALDPTAAAGTLRLVIAMDDRRAPTTEDLDAVYQRVVGLMPATAAVRLAVDPAEQRAVHLVIELGIERTANAATVLAAAAAALSATPGGLFAADHWDIGEPLRLGAIYDVLLQLDGLAHARVRWMADTPLLEGAAQPGPAPDAFDPGAVGVVRCDNDPIEDPFGRFGTLRLEPLEVA